MFLHEFILKIVWILCSENLWFTGLMCLFEAPFSLSLKKKKLYIYFSASGLSCSMQGVLVAAFELLVATCGI